MKDQAQALKQLLDTLWIKEDIALLGSSMGRAIAIMLAEMLGNRVKGIINAEGTIDINDCSAPNQAIAKKTYEEYESTIFKQRLRNNRKNFNITSYL